jgi:hypothetical protein
MSRIAAIASLLLLPSLSTASVCTPSSDASQTWAFSSPPGSSYSCSSENGGVNDMGTAPVPCEGSPNSVYIEVAPGKAECLVAKSEPCKIPMHNFTSLDYDISMDSCNGIWAAPLWMTPDTWQWGGGSGEIDSLEACPRNGVFMNFAAGGHQISSGLDIDNADDAHVTVRKDVAGIVTITTCSASDLSAGYQCPEPQYSSCDECNSSNDFACFCNDASGHIYGSGGCVEGTDCLWTLVSDIWNGLSGDDGYSGCMTAVPELGLAAGKPNYDSKCKLSVENIVVRGDGSNGHLEFAAGSPDYCSLLTV